MTHQYFTNVTETCTFPSARHRMSSLGDLSNGAKWLQPSGVKSCVRDIRGLTHGEPAAAWLLWRTHETGLGLLTKGRKRRGRGRCSREHLGPLRSQVQATRSTFECWNAPGCWYSGLVSIWARAGLVSSSGTDGAALGGGGGIKEARIENQLEMQNPECGSTGLTLHLCYLNAPVFKITLDTFNVRLWTRAAGNCPHLKKLKKNVKSAWERACFATLEHTVKT